MTTFQVVLDSIFRILSAVIPFSYSWAAKMEEHFLHFTSKVELDYLTTLIVSIAFLIYFRFDWLGLLSAFAKTLIQPKSIKTENRTLDQEILIFLTLVSVPVILIHHWFAPMIAEVEFLNSPIADGILFLVSFGVLRFSYRWNRRIRGLNHLRTIDVAPIILTSLLALHPVFPFALVFWFGMSLTNYHYDAIFKYSMLLLGMRSFAHLLNLAGQVGLRESIESVGALNVIAIAAVGFTILWMTIENLQKNLSENTLKSFQWLSILASVSSFALYFLKN
jgi:hypothetical protein